ncbi:DUF410-domain-containing protein [Terfezia boudieri ATCC MYA-4762]|uniref:DUF410-domain-containing protein n=1 Tax=Terfezia boudieri ATCC MYA-4762 TaxID=1051890 RepID=A0A3N4LXE0_9PEZI|nr:DUF410-domain-containing protein [Terfezia boudieri ATCC MYA-4762]
MSQSKVEKTRARLAKRIQEGAYYEAHQQLRVLAQRYLKAENYEAAIDILFSGAQALLQAGQGGSGGDLCALMVEAYVQGRVACDAESKARIFTLMSLIPPEEPSLRKFVKEAGDWSATFSPYPAGDPELHHFVGTLYSLTDDFIRSEPHLLLGTKSSPDTLAALLYRWYTNSLNPPPTPLSPSTPPQPTNPAIYLSRALLPYLLLRNIRDATRVHALFTTSLSTSQLNYASQEVQSATCDAKVFPDLPLVNFLGLLLLACQRGGADLYRSLKAHYAQQLKEVPAWEEPLEQIAEMYFGIRVQRQPNLFDMMGGLFGGGGGGAGGAPQLGAPPQPPSAELD